MYITINMHNNNLYTSTYYFYLILICISNIVFLIHLFYINQDPKYKLYLEKN